MSIFLKILERGREEESEVEKHQCVVASLMPPYWGLGPQPRHMPWLGIEPVTLWFAGGHWTTEPHQPGPYAYFSHIILVALWQQWKQGKVWDSASETMALGPVLVSKLFTICNKISVEIDNKCLETLKPLKVIWHCCNIQPGVFMYLQTH